MLTIQPTKTAFQGHRMSVDEVRAAQEEREYLRNRGELEEQRDEFLELANDVDAKMPNFAKKALKGGAVLTTALLGGMATGWGTKKSIQGFAKLNKTSAVQSLKKHASAVKDFIVASAKKLKTDFVNSDAYKMPANFIKKHVDKFEKTKVGKYVAKFFEYTKKAVNTVLEPVKKGIKFVFEKIKGIDKVKAEKAAVNTVGVSGGISSGVTALKEKAEEE